MDKRCRILTEICQEIYANTSQESKYSNVKFGLRNTEKNDLSKVDFMDESRVTFDRPDGWAKGWILSDADVSVV